MKKQIAVLLLPVIALILTAGCGGSSDHPAKATPSPTPTVSPTPYRVQVTVPITVYDNSGVELDYNGHAFTRTGSTCTMSGDFLDMSPGHTADLDGPDSTVLATAPFSTGTYAAAVGKNPAACTVDLDFGELPSTLDLFKVIVGQRTAPTFTNDELIQGNLGLAFNSPS